MAGREQRRAVVLGAGVAGLLAARVLSDEYGAVLVVERDRVSGERDARRGVPHGRHVHGLLARGQQVLGELFPRLTAELEAAGAPVGDLSDDIRWYFRGRRLCPAPSGLLSVSATRPVLEAAIRDRVAALPNVTFVEGHDIVGLAATADARRVTGARVSGPDGDGGEEVLPADLVVDATGRGSRTPVWLEALGYERPGEDRVKVGLTYTTRRFRVRRDPGALSVNPVASPENPRGAFFPKLSDDVRVLSLTGMLGDRAPTGLAGFLEFAESLAAPEIHEAVKDAEPLDDGVAFHFPASVRRRYERLGRFPAGLLVIGDAVCSFNPVYGQGMTVAALEALVLRDELRGADEPDPRRFFRAVARTVDTPWEISANGDLAFAGVEGRRTLKARLAAVYLARLHAAAAEDGVVTAAFMRVAGLVAPVSTLMRPALLARVLFRVPVRVRGRRGRGCRRPRRSPGCRG